MKKYFVVLLFSFCFAQEKIPVQITTSGEGNTKIFSDQLSYSVKEKLFNCPFASLSSTEDSMYVSVQIFALEIRGNLSERTFAYSVIYTFKQESHNEFLTSDLAICPLNNVDKHSTLILSRIEQITQ